MFQLVGYLNLTSEETLHPLLKRACWSLNIALQGRRPPVTLHDEHPLTPKQTKLAGTCLATTWALTECRGDWSWHVVFFKMWTHYWKCGSICFRCNAARIRRHMMENMFDLGKLYLIFGGSSESWIKMLKFIFGIYIDSK